MKKANWFLLCFSILITLFSCTNKKLTEVVEVPLPSAVEKVSLGSPDDVKAEEGTFELNKLPYSYDA